MVEMYVVDAFTDAHFKGNAAAVCLLNEPMPDSVMQRIAKEADLSETAFVLPYGDKFSLRWFTPEQEVPLCGHATLASAHTLWQAGKAGKGEQIRFMTLSGELTVARTGDMIAMDFPAIPVTLTARPPRELYKSLGIRRADAVEILETEFDYLVVLEDPKLLRKLKPDFSLMQEIEADGVIVTARAEQGSKYDILSRYFGPNVGINEDPVTGSAHCVLGPYWAKKLGKQTLEAFQASKTGGYLKVVVKGDRVELLGRAVTFLKGQVEV